MKRKIVVVGSSNTDMVALTERIPAPGETILGGQFVMAAGGKGANQAVAAARLGADVTFVARVGSDMFGDNAVNGFRAEGINISRITRDPQSPSGVALIFVESSGENCIVVAPGANGALAASDVEAATAEIEAADVVVAQLEVPLEAVEKAAERAQAAEKTFILNPAPARSLPAELLKKVDILTPNETEAAQLAGISRSAGMDPEGSARWLLDAGVKAVIITLGSKGALVVTREGWIEVSAPAVTPVDTTAAGDAFNGALAVAVAEGKSLKEAAEFAVKAASISVTRLGAQPSMPTRKEVTG